MMKMANRGEVKSKREIKTSIDAFTGSTFGLYRYI
jgi:hypothetical protein